MLNRSENRPWGFSLVELMVVTAVFLIVLAIAAGLIHLGQFDMRTNRNVTEVQQYVNAAMKYMERDITNSGQGYLQGSSSGNVNGPLVSLDAFRSITGIELPGPAISPNSQTLFSLVTISKKDNLGNGTTVDNSSSDRLTVAYQDEFFAAQSYVVTNAATGDQISSTFFPTLRGVWQSATKSFTLNATSTAPDPSNPTQNITIGYDINSLRLGDILMLSYNLAIPATTPTPVLAMVTQINGNRITFGVEPLRFNRFNTAIPLDGTGNPDQVLIYPLDRIQNGAAITATRIKLYTYLVDPISRDLVRRRYTLPASGLFGDAFENHPICQNVERLWFTYNRVLPGAPPTFTPTLTDDMSEIRPTTDPAQVVNVLLPSLQSIRRINVTLIVRSTEIDRRNRRPARFGIQSSFAPRNIFYTTNQNAS